MHTLATRLTSFPQALVARVSKWPPRQQELLQDGALGVALAVVNILSVLPYRTQQHPLWLAIVLVALQGVLLTGRRRHPVLVALAIGTARVIYDQMGLLFAPFPLGVAIAYYTVMDRTGAVWRWNLLLKAQRIEVTFPSLLGTFLIALVFVAALGATAIGRLHHVAAPIWPVWLWAGFLAGAAATTPAVRKMKPWVIASYGSL